MAEEDKLDMSLNDIIDRDNNKKGKTEGVSGRRVYVGNLAYETQWTALKDHMRKAGEVIFADILRDYDGRSKGCGVVEYETVEGSKNAINTLNDTMLDNRLIFVREDREVRRTPAPRGGGQSGGFHSGGRGGGNFHGGRGGYRGGYQGDSHQGGGDYRGGYQGGHNQGGHSQGHGGHGGQGGYGGERGGYRGGHGGYRGDRGGGGGGGGGGERGGYGGERGGYGGDRGGGSYGGGRGGYASNYNYNRPPPSRPDDAGRKLFVSNLPYTTSWQDLKDAFAAAGPIIRADILLTPDGRSKGSGVVIFETKEAAQSAIKQFDGMEMGNRQISVREDRYV